MTHVPDHEVELYRTDDAYEVCIDMPGYEAGEIDVRWHDSRLHVSAEHRDDGETRVYNRHLSLPSRIDADAVAASYRDGVLEVVLPVLEGEDPPGKRVEVTEG
jgi:HSP20 family protein